MKLFFSILFTLFTIQNFAQQGFSAVKDLNSFKSNFAKASSTIQSIESDFTQVKNLSMLKEKMNSKGKFYYKKENKVRIEYISPYKYLMVLNNNSMTVKDEQKTSSYNTRSNKMMQSINTIMLDCMRGTVYSNKDFATNVLESPKEFLLQLTPTNVVMKKMFAKIEVYLDKKDYNVLRLNMVENGGDNSLMTFTNRIMNKTITDALFITK